MPMPAQAGRYFHKFRIISREFLHRKASVLSSMLPMLNLEDVSPGNST